LHIKCAHVNDALQAHQRANGGSCHTVLAGSGFGNNPFFTECFCQQNLSDGVVDFVRTRVIQIFPFQENMTLIPFRHPGSVIKRRRPSHIMFQQVDKVLTKVVRVDDLHVFFLEFLNVRVHHFGNESTSEFTVITFAIDLIAHM